MSNKRDRLKRVENERQISRSKEYIFNNVHLRQHIVKKQGRNIDKNYELARMKLKA